MDASLLKRWVVGKPMPLPQARHERLSKTVALAVFSSDALSSVAYAAEEILLVLAAAAHFLVPVVVPLSPRQARGAMPLTWFLVLRAFSSGCTALTGVEAISNGVPAFKPGEAKNASITMDVMAGILGTLFLRITGSRGDSTSRPPRMRPWSRLDCRAADPAYGRGVPDRQPPL